VATSDHRELDEIQHIQSYDFTHRVSFALLRATASVS
jgi:hypothetical protein